MSSDTVRAVERVADWSSRLQALTSRAERLRATRDQHASDLAAKAKEVEALSNRAVLLTEVGVLFRRLMDLLVFDQVKAIGSVVTEGLKAIFHDQDLTFSGDLAQRNGRVCVDFYLAQGDPLYGGIRGDPLTSFGGGPSSLVSLVLRILTQVRLKRRPLFLLDETLLAVSDEYVSATGQFLQRLTSTTKADVLLVTHNQAFLEHADVAYEATSAVDGEFRRLKLRRIGRSK